MLLNLLPGVRDLRVPLVTGYVWLFSVWLLIQRFEWLTANVKTSSGLQSILDLASFAGRPATVVTISFVAYLVGALIQVDVSALQRPSRQGQTALLNFADQAAEPLDVYMIMHEHARSINRATGEEVRAEVAVILYGDIITELPQLSTRLQIENERLWSSYDRLLSEGDMRFNAGIALAGVSTVAVICIHPALGAIGGAGAAALIWRSLQKLARSADVVSEALILGVIKSSTVERWQKRYASPDDTSATPS
ncbi:MAG TPA: hypothetical protein VF661_14120 [Actinomycetales bacterium]|jgi:hypothetical protein